MAAHRILGAGNLLILPLSMTTTICNTYQLSVFFIYPCLQNICLHLLLIQPISPPNCNSSTYWRKGCLGVLVPSAFLLGDLPKFTTLLHYKGRQNLTSALSKSLLTLVWHKNNPKRIGEGWRDLTTGLFHMHIPSSPSCPFPTLLYTHNCSEGRISWDALPVSANLSTHISPFPFSKVGKGRDKGHSSISSTRTRSNYSSDCPFSRWWCICSWVYWDTWLQKMLSWIQIRWLA